MTPTEVDAVIQAVPGDARSITNLARSPRSRSPLVDINIASPTASVSCTADAARRLTLVDFTIGTAETPRRDGGLGVLDMVRPTRPWP